MDITKAQGGVGLQTLSGTEDRDQAMKNATAQMQARYGEKPKEGRAIKKALDKDDFMRIMITEMKHQDPTKPMDSDRMATQMAQITSVEQLKNVSNAIEKLSDRNSASDRLAMSAMIGKTITVDKGRFSHQKGTLSPVSYTLPADAVKIKLSVLDERGDEVSSRELEAQKAGPNVYNWDGINASGIQVPTASYTVRIDAEDAKGAKIKVDPISKESIVGVSFEGGDTNFLVGDAKSPQKVNFRSVIRMEGDAPAANRMPPKSENGAASTQPAIQSNGEFTIPESLKETLGLKTGAPGMQAVAQNDVKAEDSAEDEAPVRAEGFAHGLHD